VNFYAVNNLIVLSIYSSDAPHSCLPVAPGFSPISLAVPLYIAPDDYTAVSSQPATFSSAPDQMCITITIFDDEVVEETESFAVRLVSEDPAVIIMQLFASVTIGDSTGKHLLVLVIMRQRYS